MSLANPLSNAIRALSMDAVQRANSGHPGAPMGMADIAQVLWMDFLAHSPSNPNWPNRDRFVLSNGHGSMLIYALLHLTGYEVSIDDLKQFRQLHSKTPGHPEYGYTPGVETTTGPLGQGIANAVGMALAEKIMAAHFNRDGHTIVDHYTYCFLGDGCLMEGISHEACSFAGTQKLNKLIAFWDDNGISIDGDVSGWFTDDTPARFEAYGWSVIRDVDGHDGAAITDAIKQAKATDRPTLICCKTTIGRGAPNKEGTHGCHGAPLGDDEIAAARANLDWNYVPFEVPETIYQQWNARESGKQLEAKWQAAFDAYEQAYPELAAEFTRRVAGELPASFDTIADQYIAKLQAQPAKLATRKASQDAIEALAPNVPELVGGSADLAGSNLTLWSGSKGIFADDASGNYLYYGVREFAMTAIQNGLCLHGGLRTYSATFLIFMEYARNAVRMAALMKQPAIYVYTHDSIGLGEDGPTHQPVEQLVALRATPNLENWRPCDQVETAVAWKAALKRSDGPTALILTRQGVAQQARDQQQVAAIERGGYVLKDAAKAQVILIATGSEVEIAVAASEQLAEQGIAARVVSMPSTDVFLQQSSDYQQSVLPLAIRARVAVEALATDSWYRFVGLDGAIVGMTTFGESGPAGELYQHFNITVDAVVACAKLQVNG